MNRPSRESSLTTRRSPRWRTLVSSSTRRRFSDACPEAVSFGPDRIVPVSDPDVSRPRLIRDATFLEADRREIALRRGPHNQLGFAYQVAFVRVLARFPQQAPLEIDSVRDIPLGRNREARPNRVILRHRGRDRRGRRAVRPPPSRRTRPVILRAMSLHVQ